MSAAGPATTAVRRARRGDAEREEERDDEGLPSLVQAALGNKVVKGPEVASRDKVAMALFGVPVGLLLLAALLFPEWQRPALIMAAAVAVMAVRWGLVRVFGRAAAGPSGAPFGHTRRLLRRVAR